MALVPCQKCEALISHASESCIKCGSKRPFEIACCRLCFEPIKPFRLTTSVPSVVINNLDIIGIVKGVLPSPLAPMEEWYLHRCCVKRLLPLPSQDMKWHCGDCGDLLLRIPIAPDSDPVEVRRVKVACPDRCKSCGKPGPLKLALCWWCKLWVFPSDSVIADASSALRLHALCGRMSNMWEKSGRPWPPLATPKP